MLWTSRLAPKAIELKRDVRSATTTQREGRRARIILLAAEGETRDNIARLTGFFCPTITLWCRRFQARRLDVLVDEPERGRKSSLPVEAVRRVLEQISRASIVEPRWNCRSMARVAGISSTTVQNYRLPMI